MNKKLVSVILLLSILSAVFGAVLSSAASPVIEPAMEIYEYIPIASQYTNNSFDKPPLYIKGESYLTAPSDNWNLGATVGNFGGYLTYKLSKPLKNNPLNPFGTDFIVYGNGQGMRRFAEPAGVWVAQDKDNDGQPDFWYELAGSMHFENSSVWNYSVTYTPQNSGTAYTASDGRSGFFERYQYPDTDRYTYQTAPDPDSMTLSGTLINENITPVFGYADVHPNDAGDIETPLNPYRKGPLFADKFENSFDAVYHGLSRGDAMDISWAVDADGNPVQLDEITFIKFVNSCFALQGALGERSAEIVQLVPLYDNAKEELPEAGLDFIILSNDSGGAEEIFPFEKDKFTYEIYLKDAAEYSISVGENSPENVYINNTRADESDYMISSAKEVQKGVYKLRIAAQQGESAPVLYYLTFIDTSDKIKINFNADGGRISGKENISLYYGEQEIGSLLPVPERAQHKFLGWFDGDTKYTAVSASMTDGLTLTAKWEYIGNNKTDKNIKVSFRLVGASKSPSGNIDRGKGIYDSDYITWIATKKYTLDKGSNVYDLFCIAADDAGLKYTAEKNYITSIKAPSALGNYRLEEFTNGRRSGWMYAVNNIHPKAAFEDYILKDGDEVVFHYVNDYSYDISDWDSGNSLGDRSTWDKWLLARDIDPEERSASKNKDAYDILTVGKGGNVSPSDLSDYIGRDVVFKVTPDRGYVIEEIIIDGKNAELSDMFTYENLQKKSRIEISFKKAESTPAPTDTPTPSDTPSPTDTPAAAQNTIRFNDVPDGHWAWEFIYYLAERGIIKGRSENEFAPEEKITRAEFIKILADISGYTPDISKKQIFTDVSADSWYAGAVLWAVENGVAFGVDGEHFAPDSNITREEMAVMLARYIDRYDFEEKFREYDFADEDMISGYAVSAVHKMQRVGCMSGRENNIFDPRGFSSRAETAKTAAWILYNIQN